MILIDFNQIVITRIYSFQQQRLSAVGNLYENEIFPQALTRDIFDFIRKIHGEYGYLYGDVVMCADCDGMSWRREVFPQYKLGRRNRNKQDDDVKQMKKFTKEYITEFCMNYRNGPVVAYKIDRVEADDIIGHLVLTNPDEKHMIVSMDKDFHQLHSGSVVSYDYKKNRVVREDGKRILREHIIRGDSGDGIPNILSDLDTHAVEGKRQTPLTKKRMGKLIREIPEENMERFKQNEMLISLYDIPEEIQDLIEEKIK